MSPDCWPTARPGIRACPYPFLAVSTEEPCISPAHYESHHRLIQSYNFVRISLENTPISGQVVFPVEERQNFMIVEDHFNRGRSLLTPRARALLSRVPKSSSTAFQNGCYHNLFQRTFISRSGGMTAAPAYLSSSCPALSEGDPSDLIHLMESTSNLATIMARVIINSCFAKCRPGHIAAPPPATH